MPTPHLGERQLTELDFIRLRKLNSQGTAPALARLLDDADVVPPQAIAADIVTMYARAVVFDAALQCRRILAVCYPHDADTAQGRVSVLSPMGMALLGLAVGDSASWRGPDGSEHQVRVEQLLFQPEAAGDYRT